MINVFFVIKVTAGQERIAASILQNKMTKSDLPIYSILVINGLRGYIIIEGEDEATVRSFITKERNIRGLLPQPLTNEEIDRLVEVKSMAQQISIGDIVEFTTGPFKGYKAKVLRTDEIKGDVTVELMDVVVPIPITAKMNTARVIQKAEKAEG